MRFSILIIITIIFMGCQVVVVDNDEDNAIIISNDVLPITEGNWYKPPINTSWQYQLKGPINADFGVSVYIVNLLDTIESFIAHLKNDYRLRVICHLNAGGYSPTIKDSKYVLSNLLGNTIGNTKLQWLDIRNHLVVPIIEAKMNLAKQKNCDGVVFGYVNAYSQDSGFDINATHQLAYNKYLANTAHKRNLGVGFSDDIEQIKELEPYFDFVISLECHKNNECDKLSPFGNKNKAMFNVEYSREYTTNTIIANNMCKDVKKLNIQTLILPVAMDNEFRYSCGK